MKKRFFNALILGAVLLSTGAVTSCKDYDDDINNLQSQINKLQELEQLKTDIATLNAAVANAKADALAEAKKALDAANEAKGIADKAATKEELASLKTAVEKAQADADKANADLATAKSDLEALIASKASKAELDDAKAALETLISSKADKDALAAAKAELENIIADKADKTVVDEALVKISEAELAIAENKALAEAAKALAQNAYDLAGTKTDAAAALAEANVAIAEAKAALETMIAAKADQATVTTATEKIESIETFVDTAEAFLGTVKEGDNIQSVVDAAVTKALEGTSSDAGLAARIAALEAAVFAQGEDENGNKIEAWQEALKALQEDAAALKIAVSQMITSVELFGTVHEDVHVNWSGIYKPCDHTLTFTTISEQANVFTAPDGTKLEFNKDNYTTYGDSIVVRVTPSNAVLTKEMISLINSQNSVLQDVEVESVEQFNTLITANRPTRAVNNTGLWTIKFNLKDDYDAEAFKNATIVKEYDNSSNSEKVLFAVAVKTRLGEEDVRSTRNVVSEYDLDMSVKNGVRAKDFTVNERGILNIKNRFLFSEAGNTTCGGVNGSGNKYVEDLTWAYPTSKLPTPAVEVVNTDDAKNVIEKKNHLWDSPNYVGDALVADNRQWQECLAVEVGMPIVISYDSDNTNNYYNKEQKVAGFYVTLDEDNAVESGVSEINAWHSYKYTGLNTMLGVDENGKPTNTGVITVENLNNVKGDIIGFRVYAVNLDGTLLDPDGRAFYVAVGDVATSGDVAAGEKIEINGATGKSPIIELGTDVSVGDYAHSWKASNDNPKFGYAGSTDENGTNVSPAFRVNYFEDAEGKKSCGRDKAKYVQYEMSQPWRYVDGATYTQTMVLYDLADDGQTELPVKTITATMTKVMPTDVPSYSFIPGQQLNDKNEAVVDQEYKTGKFRAYLVPQNGYEVSNPSSYGTLSMGNILYKDRLNGDFQFRNLKFNFEKVALNGDKDADLEVYGENSMLIPSKRIDNKSEYNVNVAYVYRNISTKWNAETNRWEYATDYPVETGKNLTAIFACWHQASKFSWANGKKPSLQWKQVPDPDVVGHKIADIDQKNDYDNIFFGGNLAVLTLQKSYLRIVPNTAKLTVGDQVNPYFDAEVTIEGDIVFKQTQAIQAPGVKHDETLSFVVEDAYGHQSTISLPVEIKKP